MIIDASPATETEREIALIHEHRTRLTADVVAGKLDVRPAARLPDFISSDSEQTSEASDTGNEPEER